MQRTQLILLVAILVMFAQAVKAESKNTLPIGPTQNFWGPTKVNLSGTGVEFKKQEDGLLITKVLEGGGAEKAGIKSGEVITAIEGRSLTEMPLDEAVSSLTGKVGTKVNLSVRDDSGKIRDVSVERLIVKWLCIERKSLENGVLLIKMNIINAKTSTELKTAAEELTAKDTKGMILDLRGSLLGYYQAQIDIASMFLKDGQPMWLYKPQSSKMEQIKAKGQQLIKIPVVVLIDSNTSGELIAAALKKNERAKLIGEKTSGLSSQFKFVTNKDGSNEKVVEGVFYYTPQEVITGKGVESDIKVENQQEEEIINKALERLKQEIADRK
jgi:carboxyl-terminal processing protease